MTSRSSQAKGLCEKPAVEIVPLREDGVPSLVEMMAAFYAHERFTFDAAASERMIRDLLKNPGSGAVFIARDAHQAVGYAVLTHGYSLEFGGPFVLLDEIFVQPHAQGEGLGRRLIDRAASYCRMNGFGYLRLEVQKKNGRAIGVYRAYGFRAEDRFLMSLPLD